MKSPEERRRSTRLTLEVPVRVMWRDQKDMGHDEKTQTAVVSRHGALIYLREPLALGSPLRIVNFATGQYALARVVWTGDVMPDGTARVGIELDSPVNYEFWGTMAVRLWEEAEKPVRLGWLARAWAWLRAALR